MQLMKKLRLLQAEKVQLAMDVEKEEEHERVSLQSQLQTAKQQKVDLENQLENTVDQSALDEKDAEIAKLEAKLERYDHLVAFVRNLNAQQKISDFELRTALGKA